MFEMTLKQMLMMFGFIALGFLLTRAKILPKGSNVTMARLETYIFVPTLTLFNQMERCTPETFRQNASLILYGAIIVVIVLIVAVPLSYLYVRRAHTPQEEYQRMVYRYAMSFANSGFMGNFIILGVFGSEMFFKYQMFGLIPNILCSSYGLYILIPKDKNAGLLHNLKKGLLAPPVLALAVGVTAGLLGLAKYIPDFLLSLFEKGGACQGPVAMILAGVVIAGYNLRKILLNKKVYVASFVRLVGIPGVILLVLHAIGASEVMMTLALVYFGTPLGLNSIVYPATYGGDTETGASMASISHTLSVLTIPLMYYLFIELL